MAKVAASAGKANWAKETSPFKNCAACERCGWWNGWICRNEPEGFRDCTQYGKAFEVTRTFCQGGKHVTLTQKKGETEEQMRLRAFPETKRVEAQKVAARPATSVNLFEL